MEDILFAHLLTSNVTHDTNFSTDAAALFPTTSYQVPKTSFIRRLVTRAALWFEQEDIDKLEIWLWTENCGGVLPSHKV